MSPNNTTAADRGREALSALMDGECQTLETRRLLRDSADDPTLRAFWDDQHRLRAARDPEASAWLTRDISGAVRETLSSEPSMRIASWWRPLAGTAVAAGVAGLVVLGAGVWQSGGGLGVATPQAPKTAAVGAPAQTRTVSTHPDARSTTTATAVQRVDQARLARYLQRHAEYASLNANSGLMPFARAASVPVSE